MKSLSQVLLVTFALLEFVCAGEITAAEYTDESQRTIRFKVDGKDTDVTAPDGKFWRSLIVCKDKKTAFFVLCKGNPKALWWEDLHKFVADPPSGSENPVKIPLKTWKLDVSIAEIYEATDDGSRLLISLHGLHKRKQDSTSFNSYPYYLKTSDGTLKPVTP